MKSTGWALNDDKNASKAIKSHDEPSAIFYGALHFNNGLVSSNEGNSLRNLLPEEDKALCVVEVIKKDLPRTGLLSGFFKEKAEEAQAEGLALPDARLYVLPSDDNPHGIDILNPDYQDLYDQAVEAAEASI